MSFLDSILGGNTQFGDYTTNGIYAQKEHQIVFYHQWSQTVLSFKAFLTSYNESWSNNWEEQALVRRFNKQYTFNNVQRGISLAWDLPAYDIAEAKKNLENITMFTRMMYPKVNSSGVVIGMNPIWYMSMMNFVHNSSVEVGGTAGGTSALGMSSILDEGLAKSGLKGFPSNFMFQPDMESGFFEPSQDVSENFSQLIGNQKRKTKVVPNKLYPKLIRVSMDYTPILDESLNFGWEEFSDGMEPVVAWGGGTGFPYGENPQTAVNVATGLFGGLGGDADGLSNSMIGGGPDAETLDLAATSIAPVTPVNEGGGG